LLGRGLCDGLITRPEESYRLWRVVVCDLETSKNEEAKARYGAVKIQPQWVVTPGKQTTTEFGVRAEFLKRAFLLEGLYKFLSFCETLNKVK